MTLCEHYLSPGYDCPECQKDIDREMDRWERDAAMWAAFVHELRAEALKNEIEEHWSSAHNLEEYVDILQERLDQQEALRCGKSTTCPFKCPGCPVYVASNTEAHFGCVDCMKRKIQAFEKRVAELEKDRADLLLELLGGPVCERCGTDEGCHNDHVRERVEAKLKELGR